MNGRASKEIEAEKSDLGGVLAVLRRRAGLIVLCVAIATVGAVGYSLAQQKEYSASASLLFRNPGFAENLFGNSVSTPATDPTREAATNEKLVGLKIVAKRTSEHLQGPDSGRSLGNGRASRPPAKRKSSR